MKPILLPKDLVARVILPGTTGATGSYIRMQACPKSLLHFLDARGHHRVGKFLDELFPARNETGLRRFMVWIALPKPLAQPGRTPVKNTHSRINR